MTVIGPPDQIARLDHDESLKPRAILEYSKDDLPVGTPRSKLLKFEFPDAISDVHVSPEDAQRIVDAAQRLIQAKRYETVLAPDREQALGDFTEGFLPRDPLPPAFAAAANAAHGIGRRSGW